MKREEIKKIVGEITAEQLDEILSLNGADIEREKAKQAALEEALKASEEALRESKSSYDGLTRELEDLKKKSTDGDEWKSRFEALQTENEEKARLAEEERKSREKNESIEKRFNSVLGEKKFSHGAVRAAYLEKFGKALEDENFNGKSDEVIFRELTKDDGDAFKSVTAVKLAGGSPRSESGTAEAKARAIMGLN